MSFKHPEGQTARWLEILGTYTFEISHRPGRFHGNADGLSRRPCSDDCQHCTRTETGDIDRDGPMEFKTHKWKREEKTDQGDGCDRSNGTVDGETKETKQVAAVSSSTEPPRPWLQKWTNQDLKAEQLKELGKKTKLIVLRGKKCQLKERKAYWGLEVRQGLLCRRWENHAGDCITWQFIVPRSLQEEVIQLLHDNPTSGHLGVRRTMYRVQERYYWNTWRRKVERWCKKYIMVVADYFTKWVQAFPLKYQSAETVADTLVTDFVSRFGVPKQIHTDQGRNFESNLFKECKLLGVDKTNNSVPSAE
ncbi:Retrovirus-related Pol polyprotein from transposon [Apostichopus japonicus]|uniref:Retrovirus-related Pol polyprotein from transposon n=1 Tax=Stichopus japonicus TaxID=307972 RepID=A0A2G8KAC2_STIJA|nr:Retrovirus-related Pol polyprotein from transposon [Apostichopus japonicus]